MRNIVKESIFAALFIIFGGAPSYAQTEGFNVKTPLQTISDDSSVLINGISADSKKEPDKSIPRDLICRAECYLVIPSIQVVPGRDEFAGTGLLGCRHSDSGKLAPPIFFQAANVESFDENGGGLVILVTDREGVKAILGDQLQITPANSSAGKVGPAQNIKNPKSFVAYSQPAGGAIEGFDASGSTLVYVSGDTFNAYQQDIDPIDIMLFSIDVPPALRGFKSAIEEWRKGCE
jgi:lipid-binding SYLF domain-containing protein